MQGTERSCRLKAEYINFSYSVHIRTRYLNLGELLAEQAAHLLKWAAFALFVETESVLEKNSEVIAKV